MAKVAKPKKKRELSVHSRAARRGASPAPALSAADKKTDASEYKPWLHTAQHAGVSKRKKLDHLSRQQKLRRQRGVEKGEIDLDKLEKKVAGSRQRGKAVTARRADWDELNGQLVKDNKHKPPSRFEALADHEDDDDGTSTNGMDDIDVHNHDVETDSPLQPVETYSTLNQPSQPAVENVGGAEGVDEIL